jgi:hypothetical protein
MDSNGRGPLTQRGLEKKLVRMECIPNWEKTIRTWFISIKNVCFTGHESESYGFSALRETAPTDAFCYIRTRRESMLVTAFFRRKKHQATVEILKESRRPNN